MLVSMLAAAMLLAAVPCAGSGASPRPNFDAAAREMTALLQEYLRVDTTNPPGHERRAADFLKRTFDREGIACEVFDQGDDRANVLAVLPGSGAKRPLILLNHLDVVPADAERWTVPPFAGEIRDGYVWGRGATDMKGTAICQLMTMLLIKRSGVRLERDLVFLGTADEEDGAASGVSWMIAHQRDKLRNAEFVLTEGAYIDVADGKVTSWNVDVTEKSILWLRVAATGKAGHGSIPEPNGAVAKLVRGLDRIMAWEPPIRVVPAVANYAREIAKREKPPRAAWLADLPAALEDPAARKALLADPFLNAAVRATISVTGLHGSDKVNVIPGEAWARLDCRLLPGEDPAAFLETLKKVAGEPDLKFEITASSVATESPIDTELFRAIERARDRFDAGVPVLTPPLLSTTDATTLRQIGMVVYGFEPWRLAAADDRSHGDDERLSLENIRFGLEVTHTIVTDVCGPQNR